MPNVTVTNANTKPIAVLGLGRVNPSATKSGYIEEAQWVPSRKAYQERSFRNGLVIQESGQPAPTGTQRVTGTATLAAGVRVALVDPTGSTFAFTLVAAASVPAGTRTTFLHVGSANTCTLTAAGADVIGDASGTTLALTTSARRTVLVSNGVDRWTISS